MTHTTTRARERALRNNYKMWKARAQLMFKVSCGLLAAALVAIVIIIALACNKAQVSKQYTQLIDSLETQAAETEPTPVVHQTPVMVECLGDFTITYYCQCDKCCDEYGVDRPVVNNRKVVFTSTQEFANEGITVAVDPNKIPYGSLLYIEGVGYRIAQDCGGAIKENRIDVYMTDHQEAWNKGKHEAKVYMITAGGENEE